MSPGVAVVDELVEHVVERRWPVLQLAERGADVGTTRDRA